MNIPNTDWKKEGHLLSAVEYKDFAWMRMLLKDGVDINCHNEGPSYPITIAVYNNDLEIVKFLVEHGADIEVIDSHGHTPLMFACKENYKVIIDFFLNLKTLNIKNHKGCLYYAASWGNIDLFYKLLSFGVDFNESSYSSNYKPIHAACIGSDDPNKVKILNFLIDKKVDINMIDEYKHTPLHWATRDKRLEQIAILLKNKAFVNPQDYCNNTPLHYAYAKNFNTDTDINKKIITLLLKYGADPNIKNLKGLIPGEINDIKDLRHPNDPYFSRWNPFKSILEKIKNVFDKK